MWEPAIANGQSYYWREEKADGQGIYTSISADGGLGPMYHYKRELQVLVSSDGEILDLHYSSDADGLAVSEAFLAGCDLTYAEKEVQALIPNGKQLQFVKSAFNI